MIIIFIIFDVLFCGLLSVQTSGDVMVSPECCCGKSKNDKLPKSKLCAVDPNHSFFSCDMSAIFKLKFRN